MKRIMFFVALATIGLFGCGKEEPKTAPAASVMSAPAPVPASPVAAVPTTAPTDAGKSATSTPPEMPKAEAPKTEPGKDAKK